MTLRLRPIRHGREAGPPPVGPGLVPTLDRRDLDAAPVAAHRVRLYTASQLLVGTVRGEGRLSDILNLRGEVRLEDGTVRRLGDAAVDAVTVPVLVVDAFDIEIAMASRLPDAPWTRARRVHKVRYPARVDAGAFTIDGWLHVFPGMDPTSLALGRHGSLFVPVTGAVVRRHGWVVSDPGVDAVMVNRHLVRSIRHADADVVQDVPGALLRRRELVAAA